MPYDSQPMLQELLRALPVYFSSMLKFIFGPAGGYAVGLHLATTIVTTVAGTMTVVVVLTYFGNWMRNTVFSRFPRRKLLKPSPFLDRIWKRYGLVGIAALTPLLLTPIGGALLAVGTGSPREKILIYMLISSSVWATAISTAIYLLGNEFKTLLMEYGW